MGGPIWKNWIVYKKKECTSLKVACNHHLLAKSAFFNILFEVYLTACGEGLK